MIYRLGQERESVIIQNERLELLHKQLSVTIDELKAIRVELKSRPREDTSIVTHKGTHGKALCGLSAGHLAHRATLVNCPDCVFLLLGELDKANLPSDKDIVSVILTKEQAQNFQFVLVTVEDIVRILGRYPSAIGVIADLQDLIRKARE